MWYGYDWWLSCTTFTLPSISITAYMSPVFNPLVNFSADVVAIKSIRLCDFSVLPTPSPLLSSPFKNLIISVLLFFALSDFAKLETISLNTFPLFSNVDELTSLKKLSTSDFNTLALPLGDNDISPPCVFTAALIELLKSDKLNNPASIIDSVTAKLEVTPWGLLTNLASVPFTKAKYDFPVAGSYVSLIAFVKPLATALLEFAQTSPNLVTK